MSCSVEISYCLLFPPGTLSLTLLGYTNIPTDGSGRILISDIRGGDTGSLICQSSEDYEGGGYQSEWYRHPTSLTTDTNNRILNDDAVQGWRRSRDDIGGHEIIRLRSRTGDPDAIAGVFTCDIFVDSGPPITVGIYYASESHLCYTGTTLWNI